MSLLPKGLSRRPEATEFSVVDLETTGLFPERNDRVIEVAIVRVDLDGKLLDEYTTLVNPNRDLGPTHIHHISSAEIKGAPPFAEVAGSVLSRLAGTIFAGYYPHFDFRFLRCEVNRLGHEIPPSGLLCVNELARDVAPDLPGRKLEICCKHFGVPLSESHTAYADAIATANVLRECFNRTRRDVRALLGRVDIQPLPDVTDMWPGLHINERTYTRDSAAAAIKLEPNYIARLVASLRTETNTDRSLDQYFALLDRVLEDRVVIADETAMLFNIAREIGISQRQAEDAHCRYARDLVLAAFADRRITREEEADLRQVAEILAVSASRFAEILEEATGKAAMGLSSAGQTTAPKNDLAGLSICFTGEFTCRVNGKLAVRQLGEEEACKRGMIVRKGVTKDLDILVAADPNSMSGKARKARQYDVRIVAEQVFWHWMEIDVG